jgi:transcription initiation factor TFIIIB Brf1 subunit/transcription initiation factor TFIIB
MLDRNEPFEDGLVCPKVICQECDTFDREEDVIVDEVQALMICKHCGQVLNENLPSELLEEEAFELQSFNQFSTQKQYQSFLKGGSKMLRALNSQVERRIRASDGVTTESYKDTQREKMYETLDRWAAELGIDAVVLGHAKMLLHSVRKNAARLHCPSLVLIVCLIMADERIRTEVQTVETDYPLKKKIKYTHELTRNERWLRALEEIQQGQKEKHG